MQVVKLHIFCWVLFHSVSTGAVEKKEIERKEKLKEENYTYGEEVAVLQS